MGKVIVHGYTQYYAVNMRVQIYANGNIVGEISKNDQCEFEINEKTNIEFRCSFRKANLMVDSDKTTEIQISFNRLTGAIEPKIVNGNSQGIKTTSPKMEEKRVDYGNLPEGVKPVNKVAYCLLAFFLGGLGIHKFYAGKTGLGIVYLLFCWTGIPAIIGFVEMIIGITKPADSQGNIII